MPLHPPAVDANNYGPLDPVVIDKISRTSQAVAPIVGRADLLCGLLAVAALFLTVGGINSRLESRGRGQPELGGHDRKLWQTPGQRNQSETIAEDKIQRLQDDAVGARRAIKGICPSDKQSKTRDGKTSRVSSENNPQSDGKRDMLARNKKGTSIPSSRRSRKCGVVRADLSEPRGASVLRSAVALLLATAATLCKEVGATVFLLIAGAELVLFLEVSGCGRIPSARTTASGESCEWQFRYSIPGTCVPAVLRRKRARRFDI